MSDLNMPEAQPSLFAQDNRTRKRNAAEARFKVYGIVAITIAMLALVILLISVLNNGLSAFRQTFFNFDITLDAKKLDPKGNRDRDEMAKVTTFGYAKVIDQALQDALAAKGLATDDLSKKELKGLLSKEAPAKLRDMVLADPSLLGQTIQFETYATGRIDGYFKGRVSLESAERDNNISPEQLQLADQMRAAGVISVTFNMGFLTGADASELRPEAAGLGIAILGSAYMMIIVLVLSLPIGVATSVYLEEFAPQNWFTDLVEVNIANLAAVPSIVFGILGLALFINFSGLPQSAPLVGALVLTLMTLPTIIIATRASLKSVPPSIRDAALGIGASKMQTVTHHVLPLAMPGILTGTIIGLAQALGETAPLLLIGMVAFVTDFPDAPPEGFLDPATALPVQVYNWTQRADPGFVERASGAIIVLLVFLLIMNAVAIVLRRRFERRW
jgi:phosphate transport system permease protein